MILVALVLAAVQPLHVVVSYETAEAVAGSEVLASVLCTSVSSCDESVLTAEQRAARQDVLRRIDSTWPSETRRGKQLLMVSLFRADDASPRAWLKHNSCRFLLPDDTVVRADMYYEASSESRVVVVEDVERGQYLSVVWLAKPSLLPELFREFLSRDRAAADNRKTEEELLERIREESARADERMRVMTEVNGQRELLATGSNNDAIGTSLAGMWGNLDAEPGKRISSVLAMLNTVNVAIKAKEFPADWAIEPVVMAAVLDFKGVPLPALPGGTRLRRTSGLGQGMFALQPPPEEITEPFYGTRGWWTLDFSLSLPGQVARLLRGDRR